MGFLYNKSKSETFRQYFSQANEIEKQYNQYHINQRQIDIKQSKYLFTKKNIGGLPLSWNKDKDVVSIDQTDSHSLIIGPTGSKKTRLIAMPAVRILGNAGESMIISDPKAEIYIRTADYLEQLGYQVEVINLRNPHYSIGWNPLTIPYRLYCQGNIDKAYEFANDVAQNMVAEGVSKEPFWENSAASFLFGLIMLLFMLCNERKLAEEDVNFRNIFELRNFMFLGNEMQIRSSEIWKYAQRDSYIRNSLIGTIETAKDTRGGILSTFDQAVRNISIQPSLLNMLSTNDINWNEFLEKKKVLYLIMPDEKTSYHKLVSLFVKQSYEYFISLAQQGLYEGDAETGFLPIRINYILDEFSSLPTIRDFPAMITAARSRNIRFSLFIQSKHQMQQRYSKETETILANCTNWIFLTTRELSLLKDISDLCGVKEQKPILSVAQLQRLDKEDGEALILSGRNKPYIAQLPDIELYDKGKFKVVQLVKKDFLGRDVIDLSDFKQKDVKNPFMPSSNLSTEEIDVMIKDIDKKLKELDEEEKKQQKMQEREGEEQGDDN